MEWQGKEEDGRGKNKDKNLKSKDERFGFLCQYVFFGYDCSQLCLVNPIQIYHVILVKQMQTVCKCKKFIWFFSQTK